MERRTKTELLVQIDVLNAIIKKREDEAVEYAKKLADKDLDFRVQRTKTNEAVEKGIVLQQAMQASKDMIELVLEIKFGTDTATADWDANTQQNVERSHADEPVRFLRALWSRLNA